MSSYQYIDTTGKTATVDAPDSTQALSLAKNIAPNSGVRLLSTPPVAPVEVPNAPSAPSNAMGVTNSSGINLPNTSPSNGSTNGVNGLISYYESLFKTSEQQAKDLQAQKDAALTTQKNQTQPFLDKILGSKSPSQVQSETQSKIGIDPAQYFATEKASIAELQTLNEDLNATIAARDAQVAQTSGQMASNNFISNRVAQIERNAAVVINQKTANINSKAALLQASQGLFEEANKYVAQAVTAATADLKYNVDLFSTLYETNQNTIDNLDTKYQSALKDAKLAAESAWTTAVNEKTEVGKLLVANPQAAININDTLEEAYAKVTRNPTTPSDALDAQYKKAQITNLLSEANNRGGTSASTGFASQKIESDIRQDAAALLDQVSVEALTLDAAYNKLRLLYSPSEATDASLKSLLGIQAPAAPSTSPTEATPSSTTPPARTVVGKIYDFLFPYDKGFKNNVIK